MTAQIGFPARTDSFGMGKVVKKVAGEVSKTPFTRNDGEAKTTVARLRDAGKNARTFFGNLRRRLSSPFDNVFEALTSKPGYVPRKEEVSPAPSTMPIVPAALPQPEVAQVTELADVKAVPKAVTREELQEKVDKMTGLLPAGLATETGVARALGIMKMGLPSDYANRGPDVQADLILRAVVDDLKEDATAANVLGIFMHTPLFAMVQDETVRTALVSKLEVISSNADTAAVAKRNECVQNRAKLRQKLATELSQARGASDLSNQPGYHKALQIAKDMADQQVPYFSGFLAQELSLSKVARGLKDKSADDVEALCKDTPLLAILGHDNSKLVIEHLVSLEYPDGDFEDKRPVKISDTQ